MKTLNSFYPGQPWKDTDGNLIQAHGGSVLYHEGTFYWYGENKERYVGGGSNWHWGVKLYSSNDLYNWKNEGIILEPVDDIKSQLHPDRIIDRPHIIYNKRSKQFVMWVKFAGSNEDSRDWSVQQMGIAVSDDIKKPFRLIKVIRPLGMEMGDFDLWVDERDGKGYFIADRVHTEIIIADLTDDYLDVTGYYSSHFPHAAPPIAREAPAFFKHLDNYYLISSGTTGYDPNPSEIAVSKLMHGPYEVLGNPCVNDTKNTSFDCQFSSVFKHPTRYGLYIAIGDRWMAKTSKLNGWDVAETKEAAYIWLPIRFDGDKPYIIWQDEWSLNEYEVNDGPKPWWKN
ncbi:hypothetical protein HNQ56_001386 [Anaerotaenia torta]|uniref:family 43 glycosylhydrolase n=1 Tax=Anaerotaenia torta TaxID=433293 RepID=UPI003D230F4A